MLLYPGCVCAQLHYIVEFRNVVIGKGGGQMAKMEFKIGGGGVGVQVN